MAKEKEKQQTTTAGYAADQVPMLKLKEYSKEDLNTVFDTLIFESEYREEVTIRGKLKVVFRTRTAEETMTISHTLDGLDYKLLPTVQEQRAFLNLAKSLVMYQGKDLSKMLESDKKEFIRKLPTSIISGIADALAEFDRKIDMACRDAEGSF